MTEKTLIKTMPLPFGQCWAWYPDANVIALSPDLTESEREHALCEVQAHWRRSCIRIVGGAATTVGAVASAIISAPLLEQVSNLL